MTGRFKEPPHPFRRRDGKPARRKRSLNVSVDEDIVREAKAMGLNLSQILEDELRRQVREEKIRRFQEEHKEAIEAHNRFIEEHGIWSKKYRSW
jgi:antitoxin CcdA